MAGRGRSRHPQYLPYPRESRREGLFGTWPLAPPKERALTGGACNGHRGRRLRRAGRRRGNGRRAPVVDLVLGPQTYHRLPDMLEKRQAGARTAWSKPNFPAEDKFETLSSPRAARPWRAGSPPFSPSRKAATNSAASASFPIRGVPNSRGPRVRSRTRRERCRASGRARNHLAWPKCECLSRGRRERQPVSLARSSHGCHELKVSIGGAI